MSRMVSPNDLNRAARADMLECREPKSRKDWMMLCNYWASNAEKGLEESICKLMNLIFDGPLTDDEIGYIARFQATRK